MLGGKSNQGSVDQSICLGEVVEDSSILGSSTDVKTDLTAKEKQRLRQQRYRQRKATCSPMVGPDEITYLTAKEKKSLHQKRYQERKSASDEFQQRE